MKHKRTSITRRSAVALIAVGAAAACRPLRAFAVTEDDISGAKARLAEAQAELDAIASEYEELSAAQSKTLDQIQVIKKKVQRVSRRIATLEEDLELKQEELARNVSEEYKDGNRGVVDLMLNATSLEELISNLYYFDKISDEQANLIQSVKDTRDECKRKRTELEERKADLEAVSATQKKQLEAMRQKQYEAQELIEGLDDEVKKLIAQREKELLAAQEEAERARRQREQAEREAAEAEAARQAQEEAERLAREEAARQAQARAALEEEGAVAAVEEPEAEEVQEETVRTGSASAVIAACHATPSPGGGLCAGWCSNVMINAGYGFVPGNANDMYADFCFSSNRTELRPGMAVAVSTHPHTSAGRIYGHIGMYVGGGQVMDNVGYIRTMSLDEWCAYYGQTVPVRWGWLNYIELV